jgi:acetoin:2,6-dichlorophenolindophenol oxidoreductase subunit beta
VTILESVSRTGRLVVVDEDYRSFGLSGEIAAKPTDVGPGMLRAPVVRMANPGALVSYAHSPESAVLPHQERIEMAIQRVIDR